jgi:hypothetical protein
MKSKRQILFLILVSCILLSWTNLTNPSSFIGQNSQSQLRTLSDLPISIVGNAQLAAAANGGGNGQLGTPYIIKDKRYNQRSKIKL